MIPEVTRRHDSERPAYGLRKAIEAVKDAVLVEDYAATVTELRNLRARCPIHGGDNDQAFAVYPDEGRWHCFSCNETGDVIDLCRAVEGGDLWEAMMVLAQRYSVELPNTQTDTWHRWQSEKARVRAAARKHLARCYQRRLTKLYAPLVLVGEETPEESLQELEELATSLWPIALDMATRRVSGE